MAKRGVFQSVMSKKGSALKSKPLMPSILINGNRRKIYVLHINDQIKIYLPPTSGGNGKLQTLCDRIGLLRRKAPFSWRKASISRRKSSAARWNTSEAGTKPAGKIKPLSLSGVRTMKMSSGIKKYRSLWKRVFYRSSKKNKGSQNLGRGSDAKE